MAADAVKCRYIPKAGSQKSLGNADLSTVHL